MPGSGSAAVLSPGEMIFACSEKRNPGRLCLAAWWLPDIDKLYFVTGDGELLHAKDNIFDRDDLNSPEADLSKLGIRDYGQTVALGEFEADFEWVLSKCTRNTPS